MVTRFLLLPLLLTWVSFLILIFPSITSLLSLVHVSTTSVIFVAWSVLDFDMARTIRTSFVHSRLEYRNLMYCCLLQTQLNCLQHFQNAFARAVVAAPRSSNTDQNYSQIAALAQGIGTY